MAAWNWLARRRSLANLRLGVSLGAVPLRVHLSASRMRAGASLDCVTADIMGKCGRDMLDALVAGTTDPDVLAELHPPPDGQDDAAATGSARRGLRPFVLLCTVVGIQRRGAQMHPGRDRRRHVALCVGASPRVLGRPMPRQRPVSRQAPLGQDPSGIEVAGLRARRSCDGRHPVKANYPAAQYQRLKRRRGHKRVLGAVNHSLLSAIWHISPPARPTATSMPTTSPDATPNARPSASSDGSNVSDTTSRAQGSRGKPDLTLAARQKRRRSMRNSAIAPDEARAGRPDEPVRVQLSHYGHPVIL